MQLQVFNAVTTDFEQTVTLGTMPVTLRIIWNTRSEFWVMRLTNANEEAVASIKLVPNWLLLRQHKALFPLSGDLLLVREDQFGPEFPTFENLGTAFNLYYVTEEQATEWENTNGLG